MGRGVWFADWERLALGWGRRDVFFGEGRAREKGLAGLGTDRGAATDSEQGQAKNAAFAIRLQPLAFPTYQTQRRRPAEEQHSQGSALITAAGWTKALLPFAR